MLTVSYDTGYDDGSRSLTQVSCSDGVNGVMWKYNWYVSRCHSTGQQQHDTG
jgi:hypothetical protein